jgi:hypothetical protein
MTKERKKRGAVPLATASVEKDGRSAVCLCWRSLAGGKEGVGSTQTEREEREKRDGKKPTERERGLKREEREERDQLSSCKRERKRKRERENGPEERKRK